MDDDRLYQNICDQCQHGLQDSEGTPIQKRIKFAASFRLKRTAQTCRCVRPHAWLVGGAQTTRSKMYPEKLCKNLLRDILRRLERGLTSPLDLSYWTCDR
eukprot:5445850-Pyramimonas_sp.AAC.1